ncbi:Serine/threonine-protein phosphatase 6 regulatory subunit 3, partial [Mucuna pruriens]
MFWRMTGLSTASPSTQFYGVLGWGEMATFVMVETILDRDNFTLDELLDEDEIIQECKALNSRLINFLSARAQVEQLIRYIIEEASEDAEKKRFPFIACEIFTCEVDIILKTLVEDEEVVVCLLLRKTVPFMQYVQAHHEIVKKLVELIGITSIMEVLIRLIGADEHMYVSHVDAMQWIEATNVLEMIVDKFSSSDSPEVHANAAETLCAITRFAPAGLSAKISSPSFIGRLFRHALEVSRPKSVLVNSLSVCISLLDPKRHTFGAYYTYNRQMTNGSTVTANPETVEGMLESVGDLLKLLDISSAENFLLTTFGKLQPPLGKHRLKIVEFISVLVTVGGEGAEKKLIDLGAVQRIIHLFFEYPYNNFLHHHVENIIISCLEGKNSSLLEHLLRDCDFVGKIIQAEKHFTLEADTTKPTIPAEGKSPPRIGCIGHLTRISNKLVQLGNNNSVVQEHLQGNSEWTDWYLSVLSNRNAVENVYQWACGRPTALHDRTRDSDEDDYQDRDYDVAALANNLSQAFRYGIYNNEDIEEVHGSLERDDEDVYFDDESAEVVISSLRLGDDHESGSLFTNSNWFAFEEDRDRVANERSTGSLASPSPNAEEGIINAVGDDVIAGEDEELADTATSSPEAGLILEHSGTEKPVEWVEWRESSDANDPSDVLPNGELGNNNPGAAESSSPSSSVALTKDEQMATEPSVSHNSSSIETSEPTQTESENPSCASASEVGDNNKDTTDNKIEVEHESIEFLFPPTSEARNSVFDEALAHAV